jgi:hypothetical protein
MKKNHIILLFTFVLIIAFVFSFYPKSEKPGSKMSFFITSTNPGTGGNFGGLAGADAYCNSLAAQQGFGDKNWKAYLSGQDSDGKIINAKDRIGNGPWYNYFGEKIADNLAQLQTQNNLNKQTAVDEKGQVIFGRGDEKNYHDMLTGSNEDGTASTTNILGTTCNNWTASASSSAIVGHHDRIGLNDSAPMKSWVSSHLTRGCSIPELNSTGGNGLIYCFATK